MTPFYIALVQLEAVKNTIDSKMIVYYDIGYFTIGFVRVISRKFGKQHIIAFPFSLTMRIGIVDVGLCYQTTLKLH